MIAIVHSIYSQSVHSSALNVGLMDNDAERYCQLDEKQRRILSSICHCLVHSQKSNKTYTLHFYVFYCI